MAKQSLPHFLVDYLNIYTNFIYRSSRPPIGTYCTLYSQWLDLQIYILALPSSFLPVFSFALCSEWLDFEI